MRKNLVTFITVAVLAVTGTAVGISTADASTYQPKRPSGIASPHIHTGYKPKTLHLTPTNGVKVTDIWWKTWNSKKAVGYGMEVVNNCKPNCADSTSFNKYEVEVTLNTVKKNKYTVVNVNPGYNFSEPNNFYDFHDFSYSE